MFGLGLTEMVVVAVIVLLLFGGKRLPELGRGLGQALSNFKSGLKDHEKQNETPQVDAQGNSKPKNPNAAGAEDHRRDV